MPTADEPGEADEDHEIEGRVDDDRNAQEPAEGGGQRFVTTGHGELSDF